MIVEFRKFLHLIENGDATLALREALNVCREHPDSTLKMGGGSYHFYAKHAFEREYYISNNDYSKKSIVFPLIGMKNLTIDGEGAELLFHGEVLPFVIDESENVTVSNLSIDYPHPYFFQADIVAASEDYLEIEYDTAQYDAAVKGEQVVFTNSDSGFQKTTGSFLVCEFDEQTTAPSATVPPYFIYTADESDGWFLERLYRYVKPRQIAPNRICFEGHFGHCHTVGNKLVCTCAPGRKYPGMLGNRSKNTVIRDVTMYSAPAMGIVCQLCENVTLERVRMIPNRQKGRYLSVNADATHFVNCSGAVRLESCVFTNMLDDAVNCHGNYLKIEKCLDDRTLLLSFGHPQQRGVNIFRSGDTARIVEGKTMKTVTALTVKSASLLSPDEVQLEFEEPLPPLREGLTVENLTQMPELYINNCVSGFNRPRGFLPSTWRKTVITNNTFFNMNSALHFTGDSCDWFESGGVSDVLIRGNRFENAAYAGGVVIAITPSIRDADTKYHRNITIEDNYFELHEERFLYAKNTDGLVFRNNTFVQNPSLPAHTKNADNGIQIKPSCTNVTVEDVIRK